MLGRAKRIHFIGVGGIGMSGIAELLANLGYHVSGSDLHGSEITERLASLGVRVAHGHDSGNLGDAEVVVFSSAVRASNPEIVEAGKRGLSIVPRAEVLAELMSLRQGIAIAGAHGKTTTTSMIALVLDAAGLDPTAVIGGRVSAFGSNAKLGRGRYLVAEADESDRSFLKLVPRFAVITNVDREHLEAYRDFDDLKDAFVQFANTVPADGAVILCLDDSTIRELRPRIKRPVVAYGFDEQADITATDVRLEGFGSVCNVRSSRPGSQLVDLGELRLAVPGRHNILNALAAVAMAQTLAIDWSDISRGLGGFNGVERRFHLRGNVNGIMVIEDYGHHPTEIAAVIAAAKPLTTGRLIVAFQPHRFTRTQLLMDQFGRVFAGVDVLVLTDIYAAGEDPVDGVTLDALSKRVDLHYEGDLHVVPALEDIPRELRTVARQGDVIVLLGAGSIGSIARKVLDALGGRS